VPFVPHVMLAHSVEKIFKYMIKFMIGILVIKTKMTNSRKVIIYESLRRIVI
jgi:hypothetical protein